MSWNPGKTWTEEVQHQKDIAGVQRAGDKTASGDIKGGYLESRDNAGAKITDGLKRTSSEIMGGGGGGGGVGSRPQITQPGNIIGPTMSGFSGGNMADPRTAIIDQAAQAQFRTQQQNLIGQLALQASGRGPSVAGAQLQQASQANQAATFAQLASARGMAAGNPGLARNAMNTSAGIQAQTSRDAAIARMQEQMNAQGALGSTLNQARGSDIALATSQAGLAQQANNMGYQGQLQMAQQYNDLKAKYAAMGLDAAKANQMAALDIQRMMQNNYLADADRANAQQAASRAQMGQAAGAVAGVVGTMYGGPAGGVAASGAAQQGVNNYYQPQQAPEGAVTTGGPNGSSTKPGGPEYA